MGPRGLHLIQTKPLAASPQREGSRRVAYAQRLMSSLVAALTVEGSLAFRKC